MRLFGDVTYEVIFLGPRTLKRGLEGLTMVHINKQGLMIKLRHILGEGIPGNKFHCLQCLKADLSTVN